MRVIAGILILLTLGMQPPQGQKATSQTNNHQQETQKQAVPATPPTNVSNAPTQQKTTDHNSFAKRHGWNYYDSIAPNTWSNWLLGLVGVWGIVAAVITLCTIKSQTSHIARQALSMRRQTTLLRKSVRAARRGTKVLIDIERAWLIPTGEVHPKFLPTRRLSPVQTELVSIKIKNFGRTPAWITDWTIDVEVLDNPNIERFTDWQKPEGDYPSARPVPSDKTEEFSMEWNILDPSTIDDIQSGRKHLFVFGYIEYRIAMGQKPSCSHFCFHYFRRRRLDGNFEEGWLREPPTANHYT